MGRQKSCWIFFLFWQPFFFQVAMFLKLVVFFLFIAVASACVWKKALCNSSYSFRRSQRPALGSETSKRQVRGKNDGSAAERLIQSMKQFEKDIPHVEDGKEDEKEDEKAELDMIKTPHVSPGKWERFQDQD